MEDQIVPKKFKLALASIGDGSFGITSPFYFPGTMDGLNQLYGNSPEKLAVPQDYHNIIRMCYDFYTRGGMVTVVINRLAELTVTDIRNGQRKTGDEANIYFKSVLNRRPSRLMRFIRTAALEYFLTGMVLPRVEWAPMLGAEINPELRATKEYQMPYFDLWPPMLVKVEWVAWGKKSFKLILPEEDIKIVKNKGGRIKQQQLKYEQWAIRNPLYIDLISSGEREILINDVDPILRKEVSFNPYPTPYLANVLEALIFKQQLRRMDFAVATRVINAILLVQEGDKDFPISEETRENLDNLKVQIMGRANNPRLMERVFMLFSDHTTKISWISPDVSAMLNQEKYIQVNDEVSEGLGFARILVTGESRNAQAAELSTWSIQPMMEELRSNFIEWVTELYEKASELNGFRNTPEPKFTPIKLQDFIKTAAVFAQAYREGNVSRTTRNEMIGLDFQTEVELMLDESTNMQELPSDFPQMPYNTQVVPGGGAPNTPKGGRPLGSQNVPVNKRTSGVRTPNQAPTSRVNTSKPSTSKAKLAKGESLEDVELLSDEELINLIDRIAKERGLYIKPEDVGINNS